MTRQANGESAQGARREIGAVLHRWAWAIALLTGGGFAVITFGVLTFIAEQA